MNRFKKFLNYWDEALVYIVTLAGTFWALMYSAGLAGKAFHPDLLWSGLAVFVALIAAWIAENRGILILKKFGAIKEDDKVKAKDGRRKNLFWRVVLGFGLGFVIQSSLPDIIPAITGAIPAMVRAALGGAS
jgi:hypothetical protein